LIDVNAVQTDCNTITIAAGSNVTHDILANVSTMREPCKAVRELP